MHTLMAAPASALFQSFRLVIRIDGIETDLIQRRPDMIERTGQTDYARIGELLHGSSIHLRLAFGLIATRPTVTYLDTFSFARHVARHEELALSSREEDHGFAALEHCAIYLSAMQIHTALEMLHANPFDINEPDIASA